MLIPITERRINNYTFFLTAGFIYDRLNRQLFLAAFLIIMGLATLAPPLLHNYTAFLCTSVLFGIGEGGADAGMHAWLLEMWEDDNGPYMQALHFFFGVGLLIAPLLSAPFLSSNFVVHIDNDTNRTTTTTAMPTMNSYYRYASNPYLSGFIFEALQQNDSDTNSTEYPYNDTVPPTVLPPEYFHTEIRTPYLITGSLVISAGVLLIFLYFFNRYETPDMKEERRRNSEAIRKQQIDIDSATYQNGILNAGFGQEKSSYGTIALTRTNSQTNNNKPPKSGYESSNEHSRSSDSGMQDDNLKAVAFATKKAKKGRGRPRDVEAEGDNISISSGSSTTSSSTTSSGETVTFENARSFVIFMVTMGAIMFCFFEGLETINFEYMASFTSLVELSDGTYLDQETSAYIASAMAIAYTIARGLGIFLAIKVFTFKN